MFVSFFNTFCSLCCSCSFSMVFFCLLCSLIFHLFIHPMPRLPHPIAPKHPTHHPTWRWGRGEGGRRRGDHRKRRAEANHHRRCRGGGGQPPRRERREPPSNGRWNQKQGTDFDSFLFSLFSFCSCVSLIFFLFVLFSVFLLFPMSFPSDPTHHHRRAQRWARATVLGVRDEPPPKGGEPPLKKDGRGGEPQPTEGGGRRGEPQSRGEVEGIYYKVIPLIQQKGTAAPTK